MGGAIFNFSQKIGLKRTKNVRFCILHKSMGGSSLPPAPPGYATALKHATSSLTIACHCLYFYDFYVTFVPEY